MITILYFGVLKQQLNTEREEINWSGGTGSELLALLNNRGDEWAQYLNTQYIFRLVINKKISSWNDIIPDNAEVGFLPPVTGG